MGKRHKWADVIVAWSEGAEIQSRFKKPFGTWSDWLIAEPMFHIETDEIEYRIKPQPKEDIIKMTCCFCGQVIPYNTYHACTTEHNIKPQPKEPQYLYVYKSENNRKIHFSTGKENNVLLEYVGKIKLEVDDE